MKIVRTYYHEGTDHPKFDIWLTRNGLTLQLGKRDNTYMAFVTNKFDSSGREVRHGDDGRYEEFSFIGEGRTECEAIEALVNSLQGTEVTFLSLGKKCYTIGGPK